MCSFSLLWKRPSTLDSANSNVKELWTGINLQSHSKIKTSGYKFNLSSWYFVNQSNAKIKFLQFYSQKPRNILSLRENMFSFYQYYTFTKAKKTNPTINIATAGRLLTTLIFMWTGTYGSSRQRNKQVPWLKYTVVLTRILIRSHSITTKYV